jgi:hypothetical protein
MKLTIQKLVEEKKSKDILRSLESLTLEEESPIPSQGTLQPDVLTFQNNVKKPQNGTIGQERKQTYERETFFHKSFDNLDQLVSGSSSFEEDETSIAPQQEEKPSKGKNNEKRDKSPQSKK